MLAITTDKATSDQTFIDHIIQWTKDTSRPFNKDSWIRCFAHIINLCVKCALENMFALLQKVKKKIIINVFKLFLTSFVLFVCFTAS